MKIAIINRHVSENLGGSEMQCNQIATGLQERGHEIVYIAPAAKHPAYGSNIPYPVIPVGPNAKNIINAILAQKPDIVYWRFNKYHLFKIARTLHAHKIPMVFAISHIDDLRICSWRENPRHGFVSFLRCVKQAVVTAWNHLGFHYVTAITSLNRDFLEITKVRNKYLVPNFVDETIVPFEWKRPYIVWVSNIKPQKQPEVYTKLAETLKNKGVDFLMIGRIQSNLYDWIKNEHDKNPSFHYLGAKTPTEVNGILQKSLMLVHTCKPEGFPNNFIQAWLQGKPTVTYSYDPASYISHHQLGGYADSDWDVFLRQVETLIDDVAARDATGQRALDFARANFGRSITLDAVEKVLKSHIKN